MSIVFTDVRGSALGRVDSDLARKWTTQVRPRVEEIPLVWWSPRYIGVRLIEAHRVLILFPRHQGPKEFGTALPPPLKEFSDIVDEGKGDGEEANRAPPRVRETPSARDIQRMEQAIQWAPRYLYHDAEISGCTLWWARWTAEGRDVYRLANDCAAGQWEKFDEYKREGLRLIARGLNRAREAVI